MDKFEEKLKIISELTQKQINEAAKNMSPEMRGELFDMLAVARARSDRKASIEYFMRSEDSGQKVKLTVIQMLMLDFVDESWKVALIPIVNMPMGTGKGQVKTESKLLTPDGWRLMGDIKLGDLVIGQDGKPKKVIKITDLGIVDTYKVSFNDNSSTLCSEDHLWFLLCSDHRQLKMSGEFGKRGKPRKIGYVKSLSEFKNDLLTHSAKHRRYSIPQVEAVNFNPKGELLIDPYFLGALLGDGSIIGSVVFTSSDPEILSYIPYTLSKTNAKYSYRLRSKDGGSEVTKYLKILGLFGHRGWEKFIPEDYKFSSIESRVAILQGLFDTDGTTSKSGYLEYSTSSPNLAKDVQFIVWSLGGICKIRSRIPTYIYKGEKKKGRVSYRVIVKLPNNIKPFKLSRKANIYKGNSKYPATRMVKSVEYIGKKDCRCISIDSEDGLYVTDDFIVTHNSSLSVSLLSDEIGRNQNIRTQIICNAEDGSMERVAAVGKQLLSRDFRKIFPHISRDPNRPWNASKINVKKTIVYDDLEEAKVNGEEPSSMNATCRAYGINGNILGSRVERTILDDLPNMDNAIVSPMEGDKIAQKLDTTVLSRKASPVGKTDLKYDPKNDPFRALFINTPWSEKDCIFRRIYDFGYATILCGVNKDFTGYNVEIWGLPDDACKRLYEKYKMCSCKHSKFEHQAKSCTHKNEETKKKCKCKNFEEQSGYNVYHTVAAKIVFTIPLSRPTWFYETESKKNQRSFDQMYRCIVYSDKEKAFPQFDNSLELSPIFQCEWQQIATSRKGVQEITGNRGYVLNPPAAAAKFASVDLSGMNREGTVITIGSLLGNYRRFLNDIYIGAWSGDEISDLLTKINSDHPDIQAIFVEDQSQQELWIKEVTKHKEKYPWWYKVKPFKTNVKTKNDKVLGVLAMDTAFTNKGFQIVASVIKDGHPRIGDPAWPQGCPCGFCKLIRDGRNQLRLDKVSSDTLMSLWMFHSSLPQVIEMPEGGEAQGFESAVDGLDFVEGIATAHDQSLNQMDRMLYPDLFEEESYCECAHKFSEHIRGINGKILCSGLSPEGDQPCGCSELKAESTEFVKESPAEENDPYSQRHDNAGRLPKGWGRLSEPYYSKF